MFTGIIQAVGHVAATEMGAEGGRLRVAGAAGVLRQLKRGSSLAVNGCCLTIVKKDGDAFHADLSQQTLEKTALGELKKGDRVNLEPPLRLGDELGGHMLQGHVEGTGKFVGLGREGEGWRLRVEVPEALRPYLIAQGSLAVEGISLTIASLRGGRVEFAIIPYTYQHTNLRHLRAGARINLETDPIARHVERLLRARAEGEISIEELRRQGF